MMNLYVFITNEDIARVFANTDETGCCDSAVVTVIARDYNEAIINLNEGTTRDWEWILVGVTPLKFAIPRQIKEER